MSFAQHTKKLGFGQQPVYSCIFILFPTSHVSSPANERSQGTTAVRDTEPRKPFNQNRKEKSTRHRLIADAVYQNGYSQIEGRATSRFALLDHQPIGQQIQTAKAASLGSSLYS
jgi:hypothetical protein